METVKIEKRGRGRPKTKPDAIKSSLIGEKKKIKMDKTINGAPAGHVDENHGKQRIDAEKREKIASILGGSRKKKRFKLFDRCFPSTFVDILAAFLHFFVQI